MVLPANYMFIHKWNEPYLSLLLNSRAHHLLVDIYFPFHGELAWMAG